MKRSHPSIGHSSIHCLVHWWSSIIIIIISPILRRHTLSVCNLGSNERRRPLAIDVMRRGAPVESCVALLSNNLTSRLKISFVASWSDLHRDNAPVRLVVLEFTTAAAKLIVSSEMWRCVGVGERLSEPHEPHELVSLNSRVGRRLIRGECGVVERRPKMWPDICSHIRRNRRTGPIIRGKNR